MKALPQACERILGTGGVLDAAADLDGYRGDLTVPAGGDIICVVRPRWVQQLAEIVNLCEREGVAIVPRGGGTGLCGGATPVPGRRSVVVSFERMAAIRSLDRNSGTVIAEAGCTLHRLREAAAEIDCLFAIDHGGLSSQLGGNLSTNAGGNNVLRYGMAREQVLGLEVVLASGEILSELQPLRKNNSGYDLKQIFLGSEGTLGLITAAALKLHPQPVARVCACAGLPSLDAVLEFFAAARAALGQTISAFEVLSREALDVWFAHSGRADEPFATHTPWVVLLEADTTSHRFDLTGALEDLLAAAVEAGTVLDGTIAMTEAQRRRLWALREGIPVAMIERKGVLKGDTAVPLSKIPKFVERAAAATAAVVPGCIAVPFGHVGDGNIHFNLLPPPDMSPALFSTQHGELTRAIEAAALALGGTVSAEHGIGMLKRDSLTRMKSPASLDAMRVLKKAFDPANLLNPGKVIPG